MVAVIDRNDVEEHSLPWEIQDVDGKDITENGPEYGRAGSENTLTPVATDELRETLVGKDILRSDDGVVVGDGKNVYVMEFGEEVDAVLGGKPEQVHVRAECYGVCNEDAYAQISENRGFAGVLEYVASDAAFYDSGRDEFMDSPYQPDEDAGVEPEEFYDNSQAGKAVEKVLEL